jgi:hypothetical protein
MGSNAFLDIAIALVLMYLVLSMLVTVINEFIATQLDLRASTLKDGIQKILQGSGLQDKFYAHGVVAAKNAAVGGNDNHVSYMSGQTFALAVLGSLDPKKPMPGFEDIRILVENLPASNIKDTPYGRSSRWPTATCKDCATASRARSTRRWIGFPECTSAT